MEIIQNITFFDALEDIELRFLLHLPEEELTKVDRLLFWIQEAHWFYDDFYCDNYNDTIMPRLNFKEFTKAIFNHCVLFAGMENNVDQLLTIYRSYKSKIPVCGCIILNPKMTKVLLACNWSGNSWTFPRGKQNENETSLECAIREVYEEIGFDVRPYLISQEAESSKHMLEMNDGSIKLYIVPNVSEENDFQPQTRKEISNVQFFSLKTIPNDSFAVKQFIKPLKAWISKNKDIITKKKGKKELVKSRDISRIKVTIPSNLNFDIRNQDTFLGDGTKKWSVNDMFQANASITGKKYDYDGNPHEFGSQHPRYMNYTTNVNSLNSNKLYNLMDLSALALQSNDFHEKRKATGTNEKVAIPSVSLIPTESQDSSKTKTKTILSILKAKSNIDSIGTNKNHTILPIPFKIDVKLVLESFNIAFDRKL